MKTELIVFEKHEDLIRPAEMLARGEVVAFPTETVYGLGANALDPEAVARIFKAKGRPADNPLIVHVADITDIPPLVREISPLAECLIEAFMPGPITLVMKKTNIIPDIVSAGLPTVGIRVPGNAIARDLIRTAGVPVAAPSANESGSPSPTRAAHVMRDMEGRVACVIDGGACEVGLESTVVDVTCEKPVILRPGAVTSEMITMICAQKGFSYEKIQISTDAPTDRAPGAPGMKYRHYAPQAQVRIVMPRSDGYANAFLDVARKCLLSGPSGRIGIFCGEKTHKHMTEHLSEKESERLKFYVFGDDESIEAAAFRLFAGLRSLDGSGVDVIFAAGFMPGEIGTAYMNRLEKAAKEDIPLPTVNGSRDTDSTLSGRVINESPSDSDRSSVTETVSIEKAPENRTVLFVCTGNTCRSPMAEAVFNDLAEKRGPFSDYADTGRPVVARAMSAGIFADLGSPAATYAEDAMQELFNVDLSEHRSNRTTKQNTAESRLILTMTDDQAVYVREKFPNTAGRVYSLFEYAEKNGILVPGSLRVSGLPGIPDPYGRDLNMYKRTAGVLFEIIDALFPSILKDMGIRGDRMFSS